jgi:alanine dehydrogenase
MEPIYIKYLNGLDIKDLALTNTEILSAIESALSAQGSNQTVLEPRVHLVPHDSSLGHFNVLRGVVNPLNSAGVKIVGDFVNNYKLNLPSEFAILNLFDPETGKPQAILDATAITEMRTGAMTAVGAKYLARKGSKILGHVGARGSAYWNIRLLNSLFDFEEIRVHSKREESRNSLGERLSKELGKKILVMDNWKDTVSGADIVVEASRLEAPEPLLKTEWIKKGALVMPYGTMSAVELSLTDVIHKVLVDDWGQCKKGLPYGALRQHVESDRITQENLHAELGEVVAGKKPGRENEEETILFWHRGLSLSDIALGKAMLVKAEERKVGQSLRFA